MMEGMEKYAEWLEGFCREVVNHQPEKIGVVLLNSDGTALTGYWGGALAVDKAAMANHIQMDAMLDTVMANAKDVVAAAEEQEEDE